MNSSKIAAYLCFMLYIEQWMETEDEAMKEEVLILLGQQEMYLEFDCGKNIQMLVWRLLVCVDFNL